MDTTIRVLSFVIIGLFLINALLAFSAVIPPTVIVPETVTVRVTSDVVMISIITGIVSLLGTMISGIIALLLAKQNRKQEEVANTLKITTSRAEFAADVAEKKMDVLTQTTKDTHTLVNANMGAQLKLGMELSEWKAASTKDPVHIEAARVAREKYEGHMKQQAIVDSGKEEK